MAMHAQSSSNILRNHPEPIEDFKCDLEVKDDRDSVWDFVRVGWVSIHAAVGGAAAVEGGAAVEGAAAVDGAAKHILLLKINLCVK